MPKNSESDNASKYGLCWNPSCSSLRYQWVALKKHFGLHSPLAVVAKLSFSCSQPKSSGPLVGHYLSEMNVKA